MKVNEFRYQPYRNKIQNMLVLYGCRSAEITSKLSYHVTD